jgi:hypothetical protein
VYGVASGGTVAWVDGAHGVHVGPRGGPFRQIGVLAEFPFWGPGPGIVLSPKGSRVGFRTGDATAGVPKRAEIWDLRGDAPALVLERDGITDIAFASEDTVFLSGLDGTITMARDGAARPLFVPDGAAVSALALVRDGRLLAAAAAGGDDTTLFLFSTADGAVRATLAAHGKGAFVTSPAGLAEVFGPIEDDLVCSFGPFFFDLDLCREKVLAPGLLARILDGKAVER